MDTVFFLGAGSVGHIAPALAVWEELKKQKPGIKELFLCNDRPDEIAILKDKVNFKTLPALKFSPLFPWNFLVIFIKSWILISKLKPNLIFSKGGNISVPVCLAAGLRKIPIVVHESDARMGRSNVLVSKIANTVCLGMPTDLQSAKFVFTGNPIRTNLLNGSYENGLNITGFTGDKPVLLVIGGSQGAKAINEIIFSILPGLIKEFDVIHLTGRGNSAPPATKGYFSKPFATDEMADLYAITNLAISRAGASCICELSANGIPAILVPLENVPHAHQILNAKIAAASGGFIFMSQTELAGRLLPVIKNIVSDKEKTAEISRLSKKFCQTDAALQIAAIIARLLEVKKLTD